MPTSRLAASLSMLLATSIRMLVTGTVATILLVGPGRTQDFYAGKTVNLIVGYSAGGGYDQYARLLARHLDRYIPGHPNIVVQNMRITDRGRDSGPGRGRRYQPGPHPRATGQRRRR